MIVSATSFAGAVVATALLSACATAGDPGDAAGATVRDSVGPRRGQLCQVEIENATRGELEVYYSAGPERARKLDKIGPGTDLSVAVPCDARYVSVSALGVDGRYAKRAELNVGAVTAVALNQSDRKRQ